MVIAPFARCKTSYQSEGTVVSSSPRNPYQTTHEQVDDWAHHPSSCPYSERCGSLNFLDPVHARADTPAAKGNALAEDALAARGGAGDPRALILPSTLRPALYCPSSTISCSTLHSSLVKRQDGEPLCLRPACVSNPAWTPGLVDVVSDKDKALSNCTRSPPLLGSGLATRFDKKGVVMH